jgi:hypothetical protein
MWEAPPMGMRSGRGGGDEVQRACVAFNIPIVCMTRVLARAFSIWQAKGMLLTEACGYALVRRRARSWT